MFLCSFAYVAHVGQWPQIGSVFFCLVVLDVDPCTWLMTSGAMFSIFHVPVVAHSVKGRGMC